MSDPTRLIEFGGLAANRDGRLTDAQLERLRDYSRSARNGNIRTAVFVAFIGVLGIVLPGAKYMLIVPGFDLSIVAFSFVFLALAGFFLVRGLIGTDPLSRDLRNPVVRSVDGPKTRAERKLRERSGALLLPRGAVQKIGRRCSRKWH